MEKECLIIGKVNAGKTLFIINFAEFLGLKEFDFNFLAPQGEKWNKVFSLVQAKNNLIDPTPHKTRQLQKLKVELPAGKGKKEVFLVDSSGVIEGIHEEREIRQGIAQSLLELKEAKIILHIIDASSIAKAKNLDDIGIIDSQIAEFGSLRKGYVMLANKMDLLKAEEGLEILRKSFPNKLIIPVSAKTKKGFKEVKAFVNRNL